MHDNVGSGSEQPHPGGFGVGSDPKVLVATATTVAALLLAGSAYVWRRGSFGVMNSAHAAPDGSLSQTDTPHGKDVSDTTKARLRRDATGKGKANSTGRRASVSAHGGRPLSDDADATDDGDDQGGSVRQRDAAAGSMGKSARAKERRRRGKDPMKELMKPGGGKLAKILKATDASAPSGTTALPRSRTTSTSDVQWQASSSRHQEKTPSDDSSTTQKAGSSSSSTAFPSSSTASEPSQDRLRSSSLHSASTQSDRSRSKSRSRSRPRNDAAHTVDHELSASKSKNRNSDAASTISSASSSTATEATTLSSSSTAPSSLSSSVTGLRLDADPTPKADSGRTSAITIPSPASPISQGKKPEHEASDPWDWDGLGSSSAPHSKPHQTKPRIASNPPSSAAEGTPVPYASIVSAKPPKEEDSRSTVGTRTGAKQHMQRSLSLSDDNAETVEAEGEAEEEVPPLVFPSLNNPAPPDSASSSLSASTQTSFSVGPASTPSSSLSRPHSRSSNSSSAQSAQIGGLKSKSPAPRNASSGSMAPFSVTKAEIAGSGHRHVPTPLGPAAKRPSTPATASAASSPLLSGSVVPPSPSSQSFGQAGSATVALSAQTQVAGLRGALEASRLREQKQKEEVERVTKERDMIQWENAAWRRREAELQAQVQQMMHQLQSYATYFASANQGLHPPQVVSPAPQSVPPSSSTGTANPVSARDNESGDHDDDTPPANIGDPHIVSATSAEKGDNDTSGANSSKKSGDGGGVDEGSTVAQSSSVPELDSAAASPANAAVSGEAQSSQTAPQLLKAATAALAQPTPIAPVAYNPALSPPIMSPSIIHPPLGAFAHYPFHAAPPVGFGPHGLPSPIAASFHIPPHPLQPPQPHQHLPFMAPGSAPQSPGIPMIIPQSLAHINPNPFVVSPAAAYARPGTPGSLGAMSMLNGHPHPHTPAGMGMGLGNSMSSPFAMAGPGSGADSPDLTGSPSSATAFLMQDRGRRRMSSGSASGGPGRSLRARNSITMLPLDAGIGGGLSSVRGGKSSSGSSVNGDGSGEEHAVGEEEGDFNEVLASAILKRPESVRKGSSRKGSFRGGSSTSSLGDGNTSPASPGLGLTSGSVSLNGIWSGYGQGGASRTESPKPHHEPQESEKEEERPQEFVFPSLNTVVSEGKAPHNSYPGSTSSSMSQSPETKSPQLRSSTPALQTLLEEDVHEASMPKSESAPSFSQLVDEPESMERSSTAQ